MIARILVLLLIIIIMPTMYFDWRYWRKKKSFNWLKRVLLWLPTIAMVVYTIVLSTEKDFIPHDTTALYWYLFLLGVWTIPKTLAAICSFFGWLWCRFSKSKRNYGNLLAFFLSIACIFVVIYGSTFGVKKLVVEHQDLYFKDLPKVFDGYKLVHISDLHVGTYTGERQAFLAQVIDSVNAQKADLIAFTGDLQNVQPSELYEHEDVLRSLKAKDGVYSVLGNHDYSEYIKKDEAIKRAYEKETVSLEKRFGWNLLMNEHRSIHRLNDSIVVVGTENDGVPPFPHKADIKKAMQNVKANSFVLFLQHDPSAWDRNILPNSHAQLTLSGHTHGGQVSIGSLRPTMLKYKEDRGLYEHDKRMLYVSTGVGGVLPFRFGVPPTITVITLHTAR